jgi:starch synthase
MRYGTVPVARQTGGLADSVSDATEPKILSGEATGFTFARYTAGDFLDAVRRAVTLYKDKDRSDLWRKLMLNGMSRDSSWEHSAKAYEALMLDMVDAQDRRTF